MATKIQTLKIKNFKLIGDEEVNLRGRNVWLIGPNQAGKSSIIQAAFGEMPEEPLKDGASKGEVQIQLSDPDTGIGYTCTFKFSKTNQKPTLTIKDETGETQKAPATLFNKLFKVRDFNIDDFLKDSPTKQIEAIKNLCGISWEEIDAEYDKKFKERTEKNRDIDKVSAKLLGSVYRKDLEPVKPIDVIQAKFAEVIKHNETVLRGENSLSSSKKNEESFDALVSEYNKQIEALKIETEKKIKELEGNIIKAGTLKEAAVTKTAEIQKWLDANPRKEISEIEAEQTAAIEHNKMVEENDKVKVLKDELEGLTLEVNDIEKRLSDIKTLKSNQFKEAQDKGLIPVQGLSIDYEDNTLRLNGLPLSSDQINTASKIIVGLEIQAALMEKDQVRIARFDGSLLDSKNIAKVKAWAHDKDIQLFIECVSREGEELVIAVEEE